MGGRGEFERWIHTHGKVRSKNGQFVRKRVIRVEAPTLRRDVAHFKPSQPVVRGFTALSFILSVSLLSALLRKPR